MQNSLGKIFDIHFKRFRRQVKKEISSSGFVRSKGILREKVEKIIDTKMELFSQKLPDYDEGLKQVLNKAFNFTTKKDFKDFITKLLMLQWILFSNLALFVN